MKYYLTIVTGLVLSVLLLQGCELINPSEALPAYIEVPTASIRLNPNFSSQIGLKDIWIERADEFLGVHQLPAVFPVFPTDRSDFFIWGGVFQNGLSASRARYPFWKALRYELQLTELDTIRLQPQFEYLSDTVLQVPFTENFEGASIKLRNNASGTDIALLKATNQTYFQGRRSGFVEFNAGIASKFEVVSGDFFGLPQTAGNDVYAEITYKNDVAFTVGLKFASAFEVGELSEGVFFNSNQQWTTIYIHLKPLIIRAPPSSAFGLFIRASSNGQAGSIFLDNIRVIHFK